MPDDITPEQAAASLRSIDDAERAVSVTPATPAWYFRSIAVAVAAFSAVQDTHVLGLIIGVEVVYAVTIAVLVAAVTRRVPYQLRHARWPGGAWSLIAWVVALATAGVATHVAIAATGMALPNTVAGAVVGAGILLLDRWQRNVARQATAGPAR